MWKSEYNRGDRMNITKVYHIELTDQDWIDLKDCGTLHFTLDGIFCNLTRGIE